jgi:hypothetical protein
MVVLSLGPKATPLSTLPDSWRSGPARGSSNGFSRASASSSPACARAAPLNALKPPGQAPLGAPPDRPAADVDADPWKLRVARRVQHKRQNSPSTVVLHLCASSAGGPGAGHAISASASPLFTPVRTAPQQQQPHQQPQQPQQEEAAAGQALLQEAAQALFCRHTSPAGRLVLEAKHLHRLTQSHTIPHAQQQVWRCVGTYLASSPHVRSVRLLSMDLTLDVAQQLTHAPGALRALRELTLCDNNLGLDTGPSLHAFVAALSTAEGLETLSLIRNSLTDQHVEPILQLLRSCAALRHLSLCWNGLTSVGVARLAQALRTREYALQSLDLSNNRIAECTLHEFQPIKERRAAAGSSFNVELHSQSKLHASGFRAPTAPVTISVLSPQVQAHLDSSIFNGFPRRTQQ